MQPFCSIPVLSGATRSVFRDTPDIEGGRGYIGSVLATLATRYSLPFGSLVKDFVRTLRYYRTSLAAKVFWKYGTLSTKYDVLVDHMTPHEENKRWLIRNMTS